MENAAQLELYCAVRRVVREVFPEVGADSKQEVLLDEEETRSNYSVDLGHAHFSCHNTVSQMAILVFSFQFLYSLVDIFADPSLTALTVDSFRCAVFFSFFMHIAFGRSLHAKQMNFCYFLFLVVWRSRLVLFNLAQVSKRFIEVFDNCACWLLSLY